MSWCLRITVFCLVFAGVPGLAHAVDSPRIVNIINFIRQVEPRIDWITRDVLYETVEQQIACMKRHDLGGTFLLQYDALVDPRYQKLMKELPAERFEIGVWWEIPQPLVEKAGYSWRGRYPWDWHADVGFATGYSPEERVKLVDIYMADFKAVFGEYPRSVGSWFIDAHTLQYMVDRYGITASCNCKDQIGTDGYTLWGGYWNQAYYPSRQNAYMPAQTAGNQIPVPVFRMLGSDPIHQYDNGLGTGWQRVVSLEPVYGRSGSNPAWCRWYFDAFVNGAPMEFAYVQAGQENSFTWKRMGRGFEDQMSLIAKLVGEKKGQVQTLGQTGAWFKERYPVTPATSVTVLEDHSERDLKTVWFNSRYYRANLLWDRCTLRFRDVHLFDERLPSAYFTRRGTSTSCRYETLPLVDGFRWSSTKVVSGLRVKSSEGMEVIGGTPIVTDSEPGQLEVRWPTVAPEGELLIRFDERRMELRAQGQLDGHWYLEWTTDAAAELPFRKIRPGLLECSFDGFDYVVALDHGKFTEGADADLRLVPGPEGVVVDLSRR